jgi:hypothetical protein
VHTLRARILPERNFIHDLTFDFEKMGAEIPAEEYERVKRDCKG